MVGPSGMYSFVEIPTLDDVPTTFVVSSEVSSQACRCKWLVYCVGIRPKCLFFLVKGICILLSSSIFFFGVWCYYVTISMDYLIKKLVVYIALHVMDILHFSQEDCGILHLHVIQ